MTAAETLALRNDVMLSLRDTDDKLAVLFTTAYSNRVYAECLELLDLRYDLAYQLVSLGGDPGVDPVLAHQPQTALNPAEEG